MKILVIDGQGGRIGRQLCERIKSESPESEITAVGTNSTATEAMLRGGADHAATGENAVKVACRHADAIIGPVGIVIADALFGEVTPAMALAVAQSGAVRILIPVNKCDTVIAGAENVSTSQLLDDAVRAVKRMIFAKKP